MNKESYGNTLWETVSMTTTGYRIIIVLYILGFYGCSIPSDDSLVDFPQTNIANEFIQATLYLPDEDQGYYRATRFDWSGVIASLEYEGHTYFGQWFDEYSPYDHDSILGPVESFSPLGFEEAEPGGNFVKIGVGVLRRPDEESYRAFTFYDIVDHGTWKVKKYKNRVEFTHELSDQMGYSYIYQKIVKLVGEEPKMVLEHLLKNTGERIIDTTVFNHNFFVIDEEPTGPGIRTIFPFTVYANEDDRGFGDIVETVDNEIRYTRQLEPNEQVYSSGLQGFGDTASDYNFKIENQKTGAGVRITGDHPMEKLVFWASSTTSCPEPYIRLKVQSGQEISWKNTYEFYTVSN